MEIVNSDEIRDFEDFLKELALILPNLEIIACNKHSQIALKCGDPDFEFNEESLKALDEMADCELCSMMLIIWDVIQSSGEKDPNAIVKHVIKDYRENLPRLLVMRENLEVIKRTSKS